MSEEVVIESPQESLLAPAIGARLLEARKTKGFSRQDVAEQLRIPEAVIKNIETDYYEAEQLTIFVKGYIRSYAKLVGVPLAEIESFFASLGVLDKQAPPPPAKFNFRERKSKKRSVKLSTIIIIIALLALVIIWATWQHQGSTPVLPMKPLNNNAVMTTTTPATQVVTVNQH